MSTYLRSPFVTKNIYKYMSTVFPITGMNRSNNNEGSPSLTPLRCNCGLFCPSLYTKVSLTIAYVVLLITASIGNILVFLLLRRCKSTAQMTFNYLIMNMAVGDIIGVFSSAILAVSFTFVGHRWISGLFGEVLCKMVPFVLTLSIYLSIWTLVVMSVDRYFSISHSSKKPMSRKVVKRSIVSVWFIAAMAASPYLYKMQLRETSDKSECRSLWSEDLERHLFMSRGEEIVKFVLTYVIPLFVIGTMNIIIGRTLSGLKPINDCKIQAKRAKRNRKIYKLLVSIVSLFAFCWVFAHVNHLLSAFDIVTYCNLPAAVPFFFFWISHLNAAGNPIIYAVFNRSLQKGFRKTGKKGGRRSSSKRKV